MTTDNNIELRRNKVCVLLAQKQPLSKIARMMNVSYETILQDKKYIIQQGFDFWTAIKNKEYISYNQYMIMISIEKVMAKCWNIVESRNKSITNRDRLNAMRLILDAGNYEERLFTNTPELLELKELEDKTNKLPQLDIKEDNNNTLDKDNNKANKKLKRLIPV
jgi:hypothetical protein